MNVARSISTRLAAMAALFLGLFLLGACTMPPPPPQPEQPPVEAVATEPAPIAEVEDGVGGYVEPVAVVEAAPLGTSWGENISSSVGKADVSRLSSLPAQVMTLHSSTDAPRGQVSDTLQLLDRSVQVRVLRENGTPWPIYQANGMVHLQGEAGERYTVEVTNNSSTQAIEFVLVVDGVAEFNGRPAKPWGRGFILEPGQDWRFEGFRKSREEVAAFRFADVADSVAITRGSGSARDAGVIEFKIYKVRIND